MIKFKNIKMISNQLKIHTCINFYKTKVIKNCFQIKFIGYMELKTIFIKIIRNSN